MNLAQKESPYQANLILLTNGVKVLETAVGAVFAPTRFSLVRISIRDLVADGKSLPRNSGGGGGGGNLILMKRKRPMRFTKRSVSGCDLRLRAAIQMLLQGRECDSAA